MKEFNPSDENPIDKDKITETPSILPYAHTVGSALIKPIDKGRVKGRSLSAMEEQTNMQLAQIQKQIELLAHQAQKIQDRVDISVKIYQAEIGFEALIGHIYHLYEKSDGSWLLSMVAPHEWGRSFKHEFIASVKLLSDHTWEMLESE